MPNFTIVNTTAALGGAAQTAVAATYKTQIITFNSTTVSGTVTALRRGKLYDILIGTNGTPADNFMEWDVNRITGGVTTSTLGSLSSLSSALALDTADNGGAGSQICINSSVETDRTVGAEVFYVGVNQRASYRWVAAPGSEIVWPANASATATNGLAGRVRSAAYTGTATMNWLFSE
jgi:hypothetical protein